MQNRMASFELKNLRDVQVIRVPSLSSDSEVDQTNMGIVGEQYLLDAKQVRQQFPINEKAQMSEWQYQFRVDFVQRSFNFSARSHKELKEWIKVLRLVLQMNKVGQSLLNINPYAFQKMKLGLKRASSQPDNITEYTNAQSEFASEN